MLCNACIMNERQEKEEEEIYALTIDVYNLAINNVPADLADEFSNEEYVINLSNNNDLCNNNNNNNNNSKTKKSIYNKNCVLFDCGANVCMVNSKELFEVLTPCIKYIKVKGVGSNKLMCEGTGTLIGPLAGVPAMYIPALKTSIVSEHVIDRGRFCEIDRTSRDGNDDPFYSIRNYANGQTMNFTKSTEWLYCGDLAKEAEANASNAEFVIAMVNFEEMQRAGFTKSEIEKMDRVDKAHRATGFQSMYKMLRSKLHNTIAGTPETGDFGEKDIRNYAKAMHPAWCRGCNASAIEEPAHSLDPITPAGISEAHGDGWFLTAKIEGVTRQLNSRTYCLLTIGRRMFYASCSRRMETPKISSQCLKS